MLQASQQSQHSQLMLQLNRHNLVYDTPAQRAIWEREDAGFDAAVANREEWAIEEMFWSAWGAEEDEHHTEVELRRRADASSSAQELDDATDARQAVIDAEEAYATAVRSSQQLGGGDNSARAVRIREYV